MPFPASVSGLSVQPKFPPCPETYECQGPDRFTYEVTIPDDADKGAIIKRIQAFGKVEVQQTGLNAPKALAAPTGPGTFLENASATAGRIMDGLISGSRKFLAGAGGVVRTALPPQSHGTTSILPTPTPVMRHPATSTTLTWRPNTPR